MLSEILLDVQRGDEFEKTRVQWSTAARTPYSSPFTVDSAVLSQVLLDVQRGDEMRVRKDPRSVALSEGSV